jgi:hypothetical protein
MQKLATGEPSVAKTGTSFDVFSILNHYNILGQWQRAHQNIGFDLIMWISG